VVDAYVGRIDHVFRDRDRIFDDGAKVGLTDCSYSEDKAPPN
jgi:hypothetical protein